MCSYVLFVAYLGTTPISRDRFGLYAEGAASGAHYAQQVADRFHLVLNLSGAIQRALEEQSRQLLLPTPAENDDVNAAVEQKQTPPPLTRMQIRRQQQRQRRLELYEKVMQLHSEGHSQRAIGQHCRSNEKLYGGGCELVSFPSAKGLHQGRQRFISSPTTSASDGPKVVTMPQNCLGKSESRAIADSAGWSHSSLRAGEVPNVLHRRPILSAFPPRKVAILATRGPDQLTAEQRFLLKQLCSTCPQLLWMRTLALDFRDALFSKDGQQMRQWITIAKHCGIGSLVRFAFGLQKDLSAVLAVVESSYSNGQVEGQINQINRLKMIKRQMYGRAGFRLLLARVLPYKSMASCTPQRAP